VRKRFTSPPYGWSQDTPDGALLALTAAGALRATFNGATVLATQIDQSKLGQVEFRADTAVITTTQRVGLRALIAGAGVECKPGQEEAALTAFVEALQALAAASGGPAPMPEPPSTDLLQQIKRLGGKEALLLAWEKRDELKAAHTAWKAASHTAAARRPRWQALQRLLAHAEGLPQAEEVARQANAINTHRTLLADPDPVAPLCAALAEALRLARQAARAAFVTEAGKHLVALEADPAWQALPEEARTDILRTGPFDPGPAPEVGTEEELLQALDTRPPAHWANARAALPERATVVLLEAARRARPEAVRIAVPNATLASDAEVERFLADLREAILREIRAGRPVVI
jgi:hypothetical protein